MRSALQPTPSEAETPLEGYFRRIIETQPVCLTRVAADGTFLAVNDATLSLLGAERLEQILDTSLLALVAPDDRASCAQFLARITNGDRGSTEVDLTGLAGLRHTLEIHAVSLPGSPDGLPAAFCAFRDITEHRRLEHALMDAAAREEQQASVLSQERERLSTALADSRDKSAATATAAELARAAALEAALADAEAQQRDLAEQHASRQA
jgi:PAS domain S-box-containing protein